MGKDSFFSKPFALPSHNLNKFIRKLFSSSVKRLLKTSLLQSYLDLNLHLTFHGTPNSNRCRLGGLAIRYYVKWYLILGHAIWLSLYSPRSCMKGGHAVSLQRSISSWSHEKTPASSRCSQCSLNHDPSAGFIELFYILVKDMISKRKYRHQLILRHWSLAWECKF